MPLSRPQNLQKNFGRMFWIQALQNVNAVNLVITLFYINRGLVLAEIFYLSIIWSIANLLFEVPSSYLADRWGRKKTIMLGICFAILGDIVLIFAHNFYFFSLAIAFTALQFASFSGTDEALIYDTSRELKKEHLSLDRLSSYFSARSLFKIITPLIAAFITRNLFDWQFIVVIIIDLLTSVLSLAIAFFLIEAEHFKKVSDEEAGIILHAYKLIKSDWQIVKAIISRTVIFIAMFIIWRYHQQFFIMNGVSIVVLGFFWSISNLLAFVINNFWIHKIGTKNVERYLNYINLIIAFSLGLTAWAVFYYFNIWLIIFLLFFIFCGEQIRWPLYSEFYNKRSRSFNRATTLSLSNLLKSILDIPLLFIGGILVGINMSYPFVFSFILGLIVIVFFRIRKSDSNLTMGAG